MKTNEKLVQEKIDEYLEKFRSSSAAGLLIHDEQDQPRKTRGRKKNTQIDENYGEKPSRNKVKNRKKRSHSSDFETDMLNEVESNKEDDDNDLTEKKSQTKIRTAAEILAKKTKAPAQEKVSKELHEINERIIQLVQVKNMGMATVEQEKQLKKLLVEQKKKSNDLKRLKAEQLAKKRYREAKKVSCLLIFF